MRSIRSSKKDEQRDGFFICFPKRNDPAFSRFVKLNNRYKLLEIGALKFKSAEGNYFTFNAEKHHTVVDDKTGIMSFRYLSGAHDIISGLWLEAFIYDIVRHQLRRFANESEVFCRVRYNAPNDVIRHASDFDVVTSMGSTILLFECKSGRLDEQTAREIAAKTDDFSAAIGGVTDARNIELYVVYDPYVNKPSAVAQWFDGTRVKPIIPGQVRDLVKAVGSENSV